MPRRSLHFHIGFDHTGHRWLRLRNAAEIRRSRRRQALRPKIVLGPGRGAQEVWRNGMHRRCWMLLLVQSRGDRRGFLMTLRRPPLVCPTPLF